MNKFKNFWKSNIAKAMNPDQAEAEAERLMQADGNIWRKLGINSGSQLYSNKALYDEYKQEVARVLNGPIVREVWEIIEDNNFHSIIQAAGDLGKLRKAANSFKAGDKVTPVNPEEPDYGKKGTVRYVNSGGGIKVDFDDGESETFVSTK